MHGQTLHEARRTVASGDHVASGFVVRGHGQTNTMLWRGLTRIEDAGGIEIPPVDESRSIDSRERRNLT